MGYVKGMQNLRNGFIYKSELSMPDISECFHAVSCVVFAIIISGSRDK